MALFVLWKGQIKAFRSKLKEENSNVSYKNACFSNFFLVNNRHEKVQKNLPTETGMTAIK